MCPQVSCSPWYLRRSFLFIIAIFFAVVAAWSRLPFVMQVATAIADVFMRLLRLVSVPILFFSVVSVFSSLDGQAHAGKVTRLITRYTILTTLCASCVALLFVHLFSLTSHTGPIAAQAVTTEVNQFNYAEWVLDVVPSNIVRPFADNNAIAALLVALLLGYSASKLPEEQKVRVHHLFSSLYSLLMQTTLFIVRFVPIILWAFLTILFGQISDMKAFGDIIRFFVAVLAANLVQGLIILPLFLKLKRIEPWKLMKAFSPALSMAFATKSSSATAPMAIDCAVNRAGLSKNIASISFPLCTSINMNGCAAFILTTVIFVGSGEGVVFSGLDQFLWIFIATIAAIGNAGVPMGCYFLSCALLSSMNVPLYLMGAILPLYGIIDAVETALNVWSDSSVTAVVDKEMSLYKIEQERILAE